MIKISRLLAAAGLAQLLAMPVSAQTEIALYPGRIPNAIEAENQETNEKGSVRNVSKPTLTAFLPPAGTGNGAAVIVCPGGGYGGLVIDREGYRVAKELNKSGIAAFVLKYRLPSDRIMKDKAIGPLQDAQQAIKTVREKAKEWQIDPAKIGIMGFSAGGHLASTAGTHYDSSFVDNPQKTSLRPDFMILVYPVISFDGKIGHKGSSANLLGMTPSPERVSYFSNDMQVTASTPPTYLTHAGDDTVVPVSNSIRFYEALLAKGISADMHIYSEGKHGYPKTPSFDEWFGRCLHWMRTTGLIPAN